MISVDLRADRVAPKDKQEFRCYSADLDVLSKYFVWEGGEERMRVGATLFGDYVWGWLLNHLTLYVVIGKTG